MNYLCFLSVAQAHLAPAPTWCSCANAATRPCANALIRPCAHALIIMTETAVEKNHTLIYKSPQVAARFCTDRRLRSPR